MFIRVAFYVPCYTCVVPFCYIIYIVTLQMRVYALASISAHTHRFTSLFCSVLLFCFAFIAFIASIHAWSFRFGKFCLLLSRLAPSKLKFHCKQFWFMSAHIHLKAFVCFGTFYFDFMLGILELERLALGSADAHC